MDDSLRQNLLDLENRLLNPEIRKSATELNRLLADEFIEFGSSGRSYNKRAIIAQLADETPSEFTISDFNGMLLSSDIVLVTYRAARKAGPGESPIISLRSSIWRHSKGTWQMLFHQGTKAAESD